MAGFSQDEEEVVVEDTVVDPTAGMRLSDVLFQRAMVGDQDATDLQRLEMSDPSVAGTLKTIDTLARMGIITINR